MEILGSTLKFYKSGRLICTGIVNEKSTYLDGTILSHTAYINASKSLDLQLWHRRFEHLGIDAIKQLLMQHMIEGIDITSDNTLPKICEACIYGKQHCDSFPKKATFRANHILELIHSDVHGPLKVLTVQGFRYWITFIDDKSHFVNLYLMKTKD